MSSISLRYTKLAIHLLESSLFTIISGVYTHGKVCRCYKGEKGEKNIVPLLLELDQPQN